MLRASVRRRSKVGRLRCCIASPKLASPGAPGRRGVLLYHTTKGIAADQLRGAVGVNSVQLHQVILRFQERGSKGEGNGVLVAIGERLQVGTSPKSSPGRRVYKGGAVPGEIVRLQLQLQDYEIGIARNGDDRRRPCVAQRWEQQECSDLKFLNRQLVDGEFVASGLAYRLISPWLSCFGARGC